MSPRSTPSGKQRVPPPCPNGHHRQRRRTCHYHKAAVERECSLKLFKARSLSRLTWISVVTLAGVVYINSTGLLRASQCRGYELYKNMDVLVLLEDSLCPQLSDDAEMRYYCEKTIKGPLAIVFLPCSCSQWFYCRSINIFWPAELSSLWLSRPAR